MKPKKLKIGIIANEFLPNYGGMESYALNIAMFLHSKGFEIHMFTRTDAQEVEPFFYHKFLTANLFEDIPALTEFNMDVWLCNNSSYAILALKKDNVFACGHGNDFLQPWVTYKFPRLKSKFLWRFKKFIETKYLYLRMLLALGKVKCLFLNSELTRERFLKRYPFFKNKVEVVYPGVDPSFFSTSEVPDGNEVPQLISIARLTKINSRKNIRNVIRALALIKDKYRFEYSIVGDGDDLEDLKDFIKDQGMEDRVCCTGRLSNGELKHHLLRSDLFVLVPLLSKNDVEGFGIVYLEANASGVPVLICRNAGASKFVEEGINGIFAENASTYGIMSALEKFFSGVYRFEREKIKQHAKRFTWDRTTGPLISKILGQEAVINAKSS